MCCTPEPKNSEMKRAEKCPRGNRAVEHEAQALVEIDDGLALHKASGVGDIDLGQPLQVENAGVEQQPRQHLVITA